MKWCLPAITDKQERNINSCAKVASQLKAVASLVAPPVLGVGPCPGTYRPFAVTFIN